MITERPSHYLSISRATGSGPRRLRCSLRPAGRVLGLSLYTNRQTCNNKSFPFQCATDSVA
jgi:hypothetical protein